MKMTPNRKKAGGLALVAVVGWVTGVWIDPSAAGEIVGGLMGLF